MSVVIETTLGDITVDLYISDRPRTCLNFLKLCKIKYYNYNLFHTISRGFIAQTGDPTGSRSGGESLYGVLDGLTKRYFEGENEPRIKHTKMGLISFVGNDERMIGSQFFITLGEDLTYLDQKHCVFGEVVEGFDVLEELNEVICDIDDRPYQDVRITHTVILDDPYPDPKKLMVPSRSPSPSAERLQGGRIGPDEEIEETEGKTAEEVAEVQAEREAKARATILEMVGDLPDAEMAPPENVLFVCKLNPVTTDDDLEIIFNRFGKIVSCEVIRDRKTGDSLQYAFIEFSDRKACEDAYFKMDNILIDDRRIHVDFSQSVSKVKWLGKGRGVAHFDEKGRKTTNPNKSIGKGDYKGNNNSISPNNRQDRSKRRKDVNSSPQPIQKQNKSNSPLANTDKENKSRRYKDSPEKRDRSRSPQRQNKRNSRYESSSRSIKQNSSRRSYGRDDNERNRSKDYRRHSRSPRRNQDVINWSRERRHDLSSRQTENNRRYDRDMSKSDSSRKYQSTDRSIRRSRSRSRDKRSDRNRDSRYRNSPSSSKTSGKNHKSNDSKKNDCDEVNKATQPKRKDSKRIKAKTDSESSSNETKSTKIKSTYSKNEKNKKLKSKKSESDSDDESSSSSDSEYDKSKSRKRNINKKPKKIHRKAVSSSDSSETSDSSDSSSSSDTSDSEEDKKKRKAHKKKNHKSSDTSNSDSEKKKKYKRKK